MKKILLSCCVLAVVLNLDLSAVRVYSYSDVGRRPYQEDVVDSDKFEASGCVGIYDGHGGVEVADALKVALIDRINPFSLNAEMSNEQITTDIAGRFLNLNLEFLEVEKTEGYDSGSTAILSLILNGRKLVIANVGDCRAVLAKNAEITRVTEDQKPRNEKETMRIEAAGGRVVFGRVMGTLGVARAFGDLSLHQYLVPNPDIFIMDIAPEFDFLIMASDGLWDGIEDDKAVQIVRSAGGPSEKACKCLIEAAIDEGSMDNISVVIIDFKN